VRLQPAGRIIGNGFPLTTDVLALSKAKLPSEVRQIAWPFFMSCRPSDRSLAILIADGMVASQNNRSDP
ncbi:MAG: hypothetical protein K0M47_12155, partial [Rhizobium sp.]|nr:hypothetical protein [Rhizobium sp.]